MDKAKYCVALYAPEKPETVFSYVSIAPTLPMIFTKEEADWFAKCINDLAPATGPLALTAKVEQA